MKQSGPMNWFLFTHVTGKLLCLVFKTVLQGKCIPVRFSLVFTVYINCVQKWPVLPTLWLTHAAYCSPDRLHTAAQVNGWLGLLLQIWLGLLSDSWKKEEEKKKLMTTDQIYLNKNTILHKFIGGHGGFRNSCRRLCKNLIMASNVSMMSCQKKSMSQLPLHMSLRVAVLVYVNFFFISLKLWFSSQDQSYHQLAYYWPFLFFLSFLFLFLMLCFAFVLFFG